MDDTTNALLNQPDEILLFTQFAMDNASTEIYWLGSDACIHYVNKQACQTLGYTKEELLQLGIPDLDPLFPMEHWKEHWESLKRDKTQKFETKHRRKNGEIIPVEIIANYVKFGDLEYNVAYSRDITEQKKAEADALRNKAIIETALDGFWRTDCNGVILEINKSYASMVGYSVDELLNMHISQIDSEDKPEDVQARIAEIIAKNSLFFEKQHKHKDGHLISIEASATFMPETAEFIVFCRDITARKNAELKLRESEKRLSTILDSNKIHMWAFDGTQYTYTNREWFEYTGQNPNECLTIERWVSVVHPDDLEESTGIWLANWEAKTEHDNHFRLRRYDGIYRDFICHAVPVFDEQGEFLYFQGFNLDITERKQMEAALSESEHKLSTVLENVEAFIYMKDIQGRYLFANSHVRKLFGVQLEEIIGQTDDKFFDANTAAQLHENDKHVLQLGETLRKEETNLNLQSGVSNTFLSVKLPLRNEIGEIYALCGISTDITERKAMEEALKESEQRWKFALEGAGDGVWEFNFVTGENHVSKQMKKMLGFEVDSEQELSSLNDWAERLSPETLASTQVALQVIVENKTDNYVVEQNVRDEHGERRWLLTRGLVVRRTDDGKPVRMIGTASDITERKQMEEKIRQLAYFDTLTNLPNRRMLNDRLTQALALSKRSGLYGALMFIDLDNFKPLNDQYGHGVGDLLLIEAARRLSNCMREMDTVARFGGDEFVVMLNELESEKAEATEHAAIVANKILTTLCEPYEITIPDGIGEKLITHRCTASIGVAMFINHEASQEELLKWADMAMYQAKDAGRNMVKFYTHTWRRKVTCKHRYY